MYDGLAYMALEDQSQPSTLAYKYGLAFTKKELVEDDLSYFNHKFLQSRGIPVSKHRVEILKLALSVF